MSAHQKFIYSQEHETAGNEREFNWTDCANDVVVEHQQAVAVYLNSTGDVVLRQSAWPDDDACVYFGVNNASAVAIAILEAAGLEAEASAVRGDA